MIIVQCPIWSRTNFRGLLLTRKLLNEGFLLVKLKSSLRKFYGRHHDLVGRYWIICVTNDHGYAPFVVNTFRFFLRSWLIIGFVTRWTRRVPLVEMELLTLPEHLGSLPVFSGVRVTRSLVVYVCFVDHCPFALFLFAIALSVLLRYTDSDYPFGILRLFLSKYYPRGL